MLFDVMRQWSVSRDFSCDLYSLTLHGGFVEIRFVVVLLVSFLLGAVRFVRFAQWRCAGRGVGVCVALIVVVRCTPLRCIALHGFSFSFLPRFHSYPLYEARAANAVRPRLLSIVVTMIRHQAKELQLPLV